MATLRGQVSSVMYGAISTTMNKPINQLNDTIELVADLRAKSINLVSILAAIQDEFDLEIPFAEFRRQKSIGEAVDYVMRLCESSHSVH